MKPLTTLILLAAMHSFHVGAVDLPTVGKGLPSLTPEQIRSDLFFLKDQWAPHERSLTPSQHSAFEAIVDKAISSSENASGEDLVFDVMKAVAVSHNGHTAPLVGYVLDTLPIKTWWFSDGLYVTSAAPGFENLIGSKILKFGNLSDSESLKRLSPYISGTPQRIRYLSSSYLTSKMVLEKIGAVGKEDGVPLTLYMKDGTTKVVTLSTTKPDPSDAMEPVMKSWGSLVPDDKDQPARWVHILDSVKSISPGYDKPAPVTTSWIGDGKKVLYVRSNTLRSKDKDSIADKLMFGVIQKQVVTKKPKSVVIDLRLNNGGNYFETMLFAQTLPKLIPEDGHIFVLVSRATFSAAIVTAATLKRYGGEKVTIMGEPMGDNDRFWAEPNLITLPNSKIPVFYSTKLEDFAKGCADDKDCYWPSIVYSQGAINTSPEIKIHVSFKDYAAGHDLVLEAALARSN